MAIFTVLGATGFIGSHLVPALRQNGHDVFVPARGTADVYDRDLGRVIYCIGYSTDYWQYPLDTAEAHACVLIALLRRARFERLVYVSSVRLCDGLDGIADESKTLRLDPLDPRNIYDLSKGLGEALVHHGGRPATVARLAVVYDNALAQDDFLCRTVRRAMVNTSITLDSHPDTGRDYIHVDDVCAALEAIALDPREPVYHVATGTLFSNRQLAALCAAEFGCRIGFAAGAFSVLPPIIDIGRLMRDFGIRPRSPVQRLPAILRSMRTHHARD